jgi:hypothetical protein
MMKTASAKKLIRRKNNFAKKRHQHLQQYSDDVTAASAGPGKIASPAPKPAVADGRAPSQFLGRRFGWCIDKENF